MYGPTLSYGINYGHPVNWASPLNYGLVGWWMCIPNWMGGATWRDLCNRNHGTLTNMDPATDWVSTSRRGGFGALDGDGSNDYVTMGTSSSLDVANYTSYTVSCWVKWTSTGSAFPFCRTTGTSTNGYEILIGSGTAGKVTLRTNSANTLDASGAWNDGAWHFISASQIGTTGDIYIDGVSRGTTGSLTYPTANASAPFQLMARNGTTAFFSGSGGQLDSIAVRARYLTARDHLALYLDECSFYPQTLNRIRRPLAFDTGGGGGGGGNRRRRLLLCGARAA